MGLYAAGITPSHIAVRGTATEDSVRCGWRGGARTLEQREDSIRFWLGLDDADPLPSVSEVDRLFMSHIEQMAPRYQDEMKARYLTLSQGGLSNDLLSLTCHADYTVQEYILGAGPTATTELTVSYDGLGEARSYDLYRLSYEMGDFGQEDLVSEAEYTDWLAQLVSDIELELSVLIEGHESVVFMAPMGAHNAIAIETWQAVAQWDLQTDDNDVVQAVRYGASPDDPEYTQPLTELKTRITTAASTDGFADQRVENVSGLTQFYWDIGAYDDITPDDGDTTTFTPDDPPPMPTCAGVDAVDDPRLNPGLVSDCTILLDSMDALAGTASLDWNASTTVSAWEGITLNASSTRVTALELSDEDLDGTIPAALGGLSALVTLDLSDNDLSGEILAEFGRLTVEPGDGSAVGQQAHGLHTDSARERAHQRPRFPQPAVLPAARARQPIRRHARRDRHSAGLGRGVRHRHVPQ